MLWQRLSLRSPEPEEISTAGGEAVGVSTVTPGQVLSCVLLT